MCLSFIVYFILYCLFYPNPKSAVVQYNGTFSVFYLECD